MKKKKAVSTDNEAATDDDSFQQEESNLNEQVFQDSDKAKNFAYVVYPTKEWLEKNDPDCAYDGTDGYGSAPDDWREEMRLSGFDFAVSPLHDKDVNPDGTIKKPHWHMIVCWPNNTTLNNANKAVNSITKGPRPKVLRSVLGMWRYFNHRDNPEKFQYEAEPEMFNDFEIPLTSRDVVDIKDQILEIAFLEEITEYSALVRRCKMLGSEWYDCALSNSILFRGWCMSFKSDPSVIARVIMKDKNASKQEKKKAKTLLSIHDDRKDCLSFKKEKEGELDNESDC